MSYENPDQHQQHSTPSPEENPFAWTDLTNDMRAAGIPEETISILVENDNIVDAQEKFAAWTDLTNDMRAAGIPEETISILVKNNDIGDAQEKFALMRETQREVAALTNPEAPHDGEPSTERHMGETALNEFPSLSGTLDVPPSSTSSPESNYASQPPSTSAEGQDLSPEGIRAYVRAQMNKNRN